METLPQRGEVAWLGKRPARRAPVQEVTALHANPNTGIKGDRYQGRSGKRQVSLIQAEHLAVIASCLQRDDVSPALLRRNIVVRGINLLALKKQCVCIGEVVLEITGECHPCSYMEDVLGPGGYNAMRGHGGMTARVLSGGEIRLGDAVYLQPH